MAPCVIGRKSRGRQRVTAGNTKGDARNDTHFQPALGDKFRKSLEGHGITRGGIRQSVFRF